MKNLFRIASIALLSMSTLFVSCDDDSVSVSDLNSVENAYKAEIEALKAELSELASKENASKEELTAALEEANKKVAELIEEDEASDGEIEKLLSDISTLSKRFQNDIKFGDLINLLDVKSDFSTITVIPLLSSETKFDDGFVYGSMADGAGLLNDGTGFTFINNIEADYSVARIKMDADLKPVSGEYILNAAATANTAQCSGSLVTPEEHGFGPLYLSGGEWGGSSKGVFSTDPNKPSSQAGVATMLNALGQWSTENAVVIGKDAYADKTVAFIGDDHSDNSVPQGHLGMYVGSRGDLENGKLYTLKVSTAGIVNEVDMVEGATYDAEFVEMTETEIEALNTEAMNKGAMGFSRLEDVDWRRGSAANQRELYFAVTGRNKADLVGKGSLLGRVYKVVLNDTDPAGACKITCVLDGDKEGGKADGFHSPDNILVTENYAYIQEDPNGYASINSDIQGYAKLYQYNLATGDLKTVLECDQDRAASLGFGTTSRMWELTGMIDVTDVVANGTNTFLLITQNHGWNAIAGQVFTDANAVVNAQAHWATEGSMLYKIEGLER